MRRKCQLLIEVGMQDRKRDWWQLTKRQGFVAYMNINSLFPATKGHSSDSWRKACQPQIRSLLAHTWLEAGFVSVSIGINKVHVGNDFHVSVVAVMDAVTLLNDSQFQLTPQDWLDQEWCVSTCKVKPKEPLSLSTITVLLSALLSADSDDESRNEDFIFSTYITVRTSLKKSSSLNGF